MGQRLQVESQTSLQKIGPQDEQTVAASQLRDSNNATATLPPTLRTAMESLDVDLNQELDRYRRHMVAKRQGRQGAGTDDAARWHSSGSRETQTLAIAPRSTPFPKATSDALEESAPDGYLASSEALLRSLHESNPSEHPLSVSSPDESGSGAADTGLFTSLMTPLGIGSLVLLVMSSATLGYVLINPTLLSRGAGDDSAHSTVFDDATSDRTGISPDLSASEFSEIDLHSLSSLPAQQRPSLSNSSPEGTEGVNDETPENAALEPSQVEPVSPSDTMAAPPAVPSPAPVPFSNPQATESQPPSLPASAATIPSQPSPSPTSPSTTASLPSAPTPPSPSSSSVAVATTAPPSQENYVYVVTPYTGDRSLEQAQAAVSGAYVRNFPQGAQVQLGAFSTPERAQSLVQELNSQGIPAQVYSR